MQIVIFMSNEEGETRGEKTFTNGLPYVSMTRQLAEEGETRIPAGRLRPSQGDKDLYLLTLFEDAVHTVIDCLSSVFRTFT